jgi:hypothetical protein
VDQEVGGSSPPSCTNQLIDITIDYHIQFLRQQTLQ